MSKNWRMCEVIPGPSVTSLIFQDIQPKNCLQTYHSKFMKSKKDVQKRKNILTEDGNHVQVILEGWNAQQKNQLRRILISDIPTSAIDLIEIFQNTSILPDETIGLRIASLPVKAEESILESLEFWDQCSCESSGCEKCCLKGYLEIKNTEFSPLCVTSDNIVMPKGTKIAKEDPFVLFLLGHNEEVHIEVSIQKGLGKVHQKWCPAASISIHHKDKITFANNGQYSNQVLVDKALDIFSKKHSIS